jgi:menaquinone-dependent protoporphyrinogen oxidase
MAMGGPLRDGASRRDAADFYGSASGIKPDAAVAAGRFACSMTPAVLIAFATKHGSTRDVATEVAGRLSAHGIVTYTCPAADVHTLEGFDGVVLGSALYLGRLHADGRDFLHRFGGELASRPLAVFALGPRTLADEDVAGSRSQLEAALAKEPALHPFTTAVFGGAFDPAQHRFPFNRMPASDVRDWAAIRAWADDVARSFTAVEAAA